MSAVPAAVATHRALIAVIDSNPAQRQQFADALASLYSVADYPDVETAVAMLPTPPKVVVVDEKVRPHGHRQLVRSLKGGGRLAIIDFAPRAGLEPVEGVPSNRGGHGIPEKLVIEELKAAGLQVEKIVEDWPEGSYCVVFVKR